LVKTPQEALLWARKDDEQNIESSPYSFTLLFRGPKGTKMEKELKEIKKKKDK